MTPLNGLLPTDHLTNPYTVIEQLYESDIYAPFSMEVDQALWDSTHNDVTSKPWTPHAALTDFFSRCIKGHQDSLSRLSSSHLAGLVCTMPLYAEALRDAARETPLQAPLTHSYHAAQPFWNGAVWVAVWPWLDASLRDALRPHIPSLFNPGIHAFLSLIDSRVAPPAPSQTSVGQRWLSRDQLITHDEWYQALIHLPTHTPPLWMGLETRLLLQMAPTAILDALIDRLVPEHGTTPVSSYRMASQALLARGCPLETDRIQQPLMWDARKDDFPHLATIDLTALTSGLTGRRLLTALSHWVHHAQLDAPAIRIDPTPEVLTMLEEESRGPYADLAMLVARRIPQLSRQPQALQALAINPCPRDYYALSGLMRNPATTLPTLAKAFHAFLFIEVRQTPLAEELIVHPQTTRELVTRCLTHDEPLFRVAAANSTLLTPEEDAALLDGPSRDAQLAVYAKRPLTDAMIERLLHHQGLQFQMILAKQPSLQPQHIKTLFSQGNYHIIAELLVCQTISSELFDLLVSSPSPDIRSLAAEYGEAEHCAVLARDRKRDVVDAVASNPLADRDTVEFLAKRHRKRLAHILVTHPNLSETTRITLSMSLMSSSRRRS